MVWINRAVIILAGVTLILFLAFNVFKERIAYRLFERAVSENVGVDRSANLPDGLHVYLCGTGSPMPDASRAGPCIGVLAGDKAFVFDVGSGGMRNLGSMGFPITRLEQVYLTHLHSDHFDGLGELLVLSWVGGGRSTPTPIFGPTGTIEVVNGFNTAYRIDSTYRVTHHGPDIANPEGFGGIASEIKLPIGPAAKAVVYDKGDLKITAIGVNHAPVDPALGYRIDYKDRSISISGDTVYHPAFNAASKDVDIMFHEALNVEMVSKMGAVLSDRGLTNNATIFADILDYHTDPKDAARAAQEASAEQLVLYHLVPPLPVELLEAAFVGEAKAAFDGEIVVGRDRMLFSLPSGSDKIVTSGP